MAESVWSQCGPGLLEQAGSFYGQQRQASEREKLLRRAQGPLYDQQQQMAGQSLALARGTDPKAMAAERCAVQQNLLAPGNEADMNNLMQMLQSKGLLGLSSYSAVPGAQQQGASANPYVTSLLAAQQGAKQKSAYDSLAEGERYLDQLVRRGGALQGQAQDARYSGQAALQQAQLRGRKPNITDTLLKGGMKLLSNKPAQDAIWEQLKKIPGLFGVGGGGDASYFGDTSSDFYA